MSSEDVIAATLFIALLTLIEQIDHEYIQNALFLWNLTFIRNSLIFSLCCDISVFFLGEDLFDDIVILFAIILQELETMWKLTLS